MKHAYKAVAALMLSLTLAFPAAAAPGPIETILSAPFEIAGSLVNFAVNLPDSLTDHPRRMRRAARTHIKHVRHRRRRQPAYRFEEPVEDI